MKKVKEIYYLDEEEKRNPEKVGYYSDGFCFVLEDGTKIYTQSTDVCGAKCVASVAVKN